MPDDEYVTTLPDASAEFTGTYDPDVLAKFLPPGPPRFEVSVTLNAKPGERYAQEDADAILGRPAEVHLDGRVFVGRWTHAIVSDDGATLDLTAEVTPR